MLSLYIWFFGDSRPWVATCYCRDRSVVRCAFVAAVVCFRFAYVFFYEVALSMEDEDGVAYGRTCDQS